MSRYDELIGAIVIGLVLSTACLVLLALSTATIAVWLIVPVIKNRLTLYWQRKSDNGTLPMKGTARRSSEF